MSTWYANVISCAVYQDVLLAREIHCGTLGLSDSIFVLGKIWSIDESERAQPGGWTDHDGAMPTLKSLRPPRRSLRSCICLNKFPASMIGR